MAAAMIAKMAALTATEYSHFKISTHAHFKV